MKKTSIMPTKTDNFTQKIIDDDDDEDNEVGFIKNCASVYQRS